MGNVTCPSCGAEFDSKEKKCPACGAKNNLKLCHVCGAQMAKGAKRCPKCGAKNKKPIYKRGWFWVLLVILLFAIPWPFGSESDSETPASAAQTEPPQEQATPTATPIPTPEVEILELVGGIEGTEGEYDSFGSSIHITGQVKNNSDKVLDYAQITFSLYDANGNVVGTAMDNIVNLGGGEIWSFDALGITSGEAESYKMTELSGNYFG